MVSCCVPNCKNKSSRRKNGNITYHRFPSDAETRKQWIENVKRDNLPPWKNCYVCSIHFTEESFEQDRYRAELTGQKMYRKVKKDSVPTLFDFETDEDTTEVDPQELKRERRRRRRIRNQIAALYRINTAIESFGLKLNVIKTEEEKICRLIKEIISKVIGFNKKDGNLEDEVSSLFDVQGDFEKITIGINKARNGNDCVSLRLREILKDKKDYLGEDDMPQTEAAEPDEEVVEQMKPIPGINPVNDTPNITQTITSYVDGNDEIVFTPDDNGPLEGMVIAMEGQQNEGRSLTDASELQLKVLQVFRCDAQTKTAQGSSTDAPQKTPANPSHSGSTQDEPLEGDSKNSSRIIMNDKILELVPIPESLPATPVADLLSSSRHLSTPPKLNPEELSLFNSETVRRLMEAQGKENTPISDTTTHAAATPRPNSVSRLQEGVSITGFDSIKHILNGLRLSNQTSATEQPFTILIDPAGTVNKPRLVFQGNKVKVDKRKSKKESQQDVGSPAEVKSVIKSELDNLNKRKPFECEKCHASYTKRTTLNRHLEIHAGESKHRCQECGKQFMSRIPLESHMRSHTGSKPYKCNTCGKGFTLHSNVTRHMLTHTGERPFKCVICGKTYNQRPLLKIHMRTHTGERPYQCPECPKRFGSRGLLNNHSHCHKGRRDPAKASPKKTDPDGFFPCDECDKIFPQKYRLTAHKRAHLGLRPYACEDCGKAFPTKGQLQLHDRSHTGDKPYACDLCPAKFAGKANLSRHKMIHTGEKPYVCHVCDKSFGQKAQLKYHWKVRLGKKDHLVMPEKFYPIKSSHNVSENAVTASDLEKDAGEKGHSVMQENSNPLSSSDAISEDAFATSNLEREVGEKGHSVMQETFAPLSSSDAISEDAFATSNLETEGDGKGHPVMPETFDPLSSSDAISEDAFATSNLEREADGKGHPVMPETFNPLSSSDAISEDAFATSNLGETFDVLEALID